MRNHGHSSALQADRDAPMAINHRVPIYNLYHYRMLRRNRRNEPLTQKALALAVDLSPTHYGSLERGTHGTTEKTRRRLAKRLGVPVAYLATPL